MCSGQFGVLDRLVSLTSEVFCSLKTEARVGAGPLLMLPRPVVFLIKCVSSVSFVCSTSLRKLIPLERPRLLVPEKNPDVHMKWKNVRILKII